VVLLFLKKKTLFGRGRDAMLPTMLIFLTSLSTDAAKTELQDGGGEEVHTLTHISVTSDEEE